MNSLLTSFLWNYVPAIPNLVVHLWNADCQSNYLTPLQIIGRFGFSRQVIFDAPRRTLCLDTQQKYIFREVKTTYNLEQREQFLKSCLDPGAKLQIMSHQKEFQYLEVLNEV